MKIVIDANIIISLLIKPENQFNLFYNNNLELITPSFLWKEIEKHMIIIHKKSNLDFNDLYLFIKTIKPHVTTISETKYLKYRKNAQEICPDINDVEYFALAMYLNCPIWTNDKKLKNQSKVEILNTSDLIAKLEH